MQKETSEKKVTEGTAKVETKSAEKKDVKSATVLSATGLVMRTYTEEHTDKEKGFVDKARGYSQKIGGTVKLM